MSNYAAVNVDNFGVYQGCRDINDPLVASIDEVRISKNRPTYRHFAAPATLTSHTNWDTNSITPGSLLSSIDGKLLNILNNISLTKVQKSPTIDTATRSKAFTTLANHRL